MAVKSVRETAVESELVRRVEAAGGTCEKVRVTGRRGFFDRLAVFPGGKVFFIEVKRPRRGRITAHQIWYATRYRELGANVALVRNCADIDELMTNQCK